MIKTQTTLFLLCLTIHLAQAQVTRIAIIGCHDQHSPAPTLTYLADTLEPDFCVWVGDNVYADTRDNAQYIREQLDVLEDKPGFKRLRDNSEFLVTWDDHDYGLNNAGKEYPLKEESKAIHRDFWQLEDEVPADRDGVYYAKIMQRPDGKKIQFIMLDGRYNRDKRGRRADALGEQQWEWLEGELEKEADLRFIVSGYQILLKRPNRWESWIKLGKSRKKLFNTIKKTNAKGVVFITGDQHYVEVLRRKRGVGYPVYEIMASGINKTERHGWARNRVAGPDRTLHSAPLITVYWNGIAGHPPHLHFTNRNVETGRITLSYRINL